MKVEIKMLKEALSSAGVEFSVYISTSTYVKLSNSRFKQVRFSDHNGRKTSKKSLEVRSDAMTSRKKGIFNIKDIKHLISYLLK